MSLSSRHQAHLINLLNNLQKLNKRTLREMVRLFGSGCWKSPHMLLPSAQREKGYSKLKARASQYFALKLIQMTQIHRFTQYG